MGRFGSGKSSEASGITCIKMQKYENREIMERSIKLFLIEYFSIQYF
jgi:hypothetical protein